MKIIKGGVTKPKGFLANGLSCGIKQSGKPDLALIYSETQANCAAVFTKNSVKAAPLLVSQRHVQNHKAQAVIVNSGNANCFTGSFGLLYAQKSAQLFGDLLKIKTNDVIVASTGIIGKPLPYHKIEKAASKLTQGLSPNGSERAAKAILTTDLQIKQIAVECKLAGKKITVAGCAKGSGMIAPNMATMLAFVTTDAAIAPKLLRKTLRDINEKTFNCISVDGCMSTNDMVVVLANGKAGNKIISKTGAAYDQFCKALDIVCRDLAKKIVVDGEGATKFITIEVEGAKSGKQAKDVGLAIANSVLVKTAAFGSNPNWGRVAAAVGSLGIAKVTEKKLKIRFSPFDKKEITIKVDLNIGREKAVIYTSDLTYEYVRINTEYT